MMSQTRQGDKGRLMTTKSFLSMMMIVSVLSVVAVGLVPNVEAFSNPTLYPIRINTVRTMTASSSSYRNLEVDVGTRTRNAFHLKHQPRKSSSSLLQAGVEKSNDAIEIDTSNEFDIDEEPFWQFSTRKAVEMWPKEVYFDHELFPFWFC